MLEYFTVYQMGFQLGAPTPLLYLAYLAVVVLLLNDRPAEGWKGSEKRLLELVAFWGIMQVVSAVYYGLFGTNYLNQAQEIAGTLLYAAVRSPFPVRQRVVMGCAMWSAKMLLISIHGAAGMALNMAGVAVLTVGMVLIAAFLRRFAVEEFLLAPRHHIAVVGALTLCGLIASANWKREPGTFDGYTMVVDSVLLLTLGLVYYLFYYVNAEYQKNQELAVVEQRLKADEDVLLLTQKNRDEMRILRHELKNHDAYIRGLLAQGRYEELEKYVQREMSSIVHITPQADSGNQVIDTVLDEKLALAEAAGIQIQYRLAVPEKLPFGDAEFSSMLSNLIDNGMEASSACPQEQRVIQLSITQERDYLFLHMENPYSPTVSDEDRLRLVTTKKEKTAHGYGTKVIQRVVRRYNGEVDYTIRDGKFVSDIMMAIIWETGPGGAAGTGSRAREGAGAGAAAVMGLGQKQEGRK